MMVYLMLTGPVTNARCYGGKRLILNTLVDYALNAFTFLLSFHWPFIWLGGDHAKAKADDHFLAQRAIRTELQDKLKA